MSKQDGQDGGRIEIESNEKYILIEGANIGLARNLALEELLGIHKDDPS